MNTHFNEKLKHPYYKLIDFTDEKHQLGLNFWDREDLIEWLSWNDRNDRNGDYRDEASLGGFDNILSKKEAMEIITKQITES